MCSARWVRGRSLSLLRDFGSVTIRSVERRPTHGWRWSRGCEIVAHVTKIHQAPVVGPEHSAAERLWFNNEMKLTKPRKARMGATLQLISVLDGHERLR